MKTNRSYCKQCGAEIVWKQSKAGKWYPVEAENGKVIMSGGYHTNSNSLPVIHHCLSQSEKLEKIATLRAELAKMEDVDPADWFQPSKSAIDDLKKVIAELEKEMSK